VKEVPLPELPSGPLQRPLPDGTVPEPIVVRTEEHWVSIMVAMLAIMMVIMVATSFVGALHPSSNVEVIDSRTLHLKGEFVESNLGTAVEPDGSVTVRIIAQQFDFVPRCIVVPADTPVKFRLTSDDVVHSFCSRYQYQHYGDARLRLGSAHPIRPAGRLCNALP